jgi:hypothetical protein
MPLVTPTAAFCALRVLLLTVLASREFFNILSTSSLALAALSTLSSFRGSLLTLLITILSAVTFVI